MRRFLKVSALCILVFGPATAGSPEVLVPAGVAAIPVAAALGIASSILSIAASVKSLFGNNSGADEAFQHEAIARLNSIDNQLSGIQSRLDAINSRFDELQVHLDKQFEHQRVVDVLAVLRNIDQHYATWIAPGYTPDPSGPIPVPSQILAELQRTVAAVREYPSYANFSTIALGMAYEHLLLLSVFHQTDESKDSQRGFAQYASFFKDAASVSTDRTGTIGQSWIAADIALKQVDASYATLPKPLYCSTGSHLCVPSNPNDWNWYYNVVRAVPYTGDPLSGFLQSKVSNVADRDCAGVFVDGPGGNPEGVCKNNPPIFPRQRFCSQIAPAQLSNGINSPCPLDQLHQTAVERKRAVDELHAALQSLRLYYVQAARWAGTPPSRIVFLSPDRPIPVKPQQ